MSQENVEAFKRGVDALNRGDVDSLLRELDPAIEWHMAIQELVGGMAAVYHGHAGVAEYLRDMDDAFAEVENDYSELRDLGSRVLATGSFRTRGRHSGAVIESRVAALVDINDEARATRVLTYLDPVEALVGVGLSKPAVAPANVDLALRQVDAVNRRDADAFAATVSPDVEWEDASFWSESQRTYRGRAEVREWFLQVVVEPWESLQCRVEEIAEASAGRLFFGGVLVARGRESGADTRLHFWMVNWVADGLVARRRVFLERAEALEAAGLRE